MNVLQDNPITCPGCGASSPDQVIRYGRHSACESCGWRSEDFDKISFPPSDPVLDFLADLGHFGSPELHTRLAHRELRARIEGFRAKWLTKVAQPNNPTICPKCRESLVVCLPATSEFPIRTEWRCEKCGHHSEKYYEVKNVQDEAERKRQAIVNRFIAADPYGTALILEQARHAAANIVANNERRTSTTVEPTTSGQQPRPRPERPIERYPQTGRDGGPSGVALATAKEQQQFLAVNIPKFSKPTSRERETRFREYTSHLKLAIRSALNADLRLDNYAIRDWIDCGNLPEVTKQFKSKDNPTGSLATAYTVSKKHRGTIGKAIEKVRVDLGIPAP